MVDLDELEQLEKEATPGPLVVSPGYFYGYTVCHNSHKERVAVYNRKGNMRHADAILFATTRNALPELIAELRAARDCVAMLRQAYKVGAIAHWFDEDGDGGEFVLAKYDEAVKL